MPLEANLFYGGVPSSPSSSRRTKRLSSTDMPAGTSTTTAASTSAMPVASTSRVGHTPSPSRTSRIPPPPPASPTPTSRRTAGSGGSRRRSAATSKVSPDKFKLHFQGRVYRPFAATSPSKARKLYSPSQGLLGQPDELVQDADAIIDCVCERNIDDSSLMIQCEECDIWLHAKCVGIHYEEECPQEYYCRKCAPRKAGQNEEQSRSSRLCTPIPHQSNTRTSPSLSQGASMSESEDDGGLEVEVPALLASSPLTRTPTRTPSKRTAASPSQYSISRNLLSDFADASPILKASPSHPLLTPSKRSKASTTENEEEGTTTPQKRSRNEVDASSSLDASNVPLPDHYTSLLNLHAAVERALLLHLATEGSRACSAAVTSSDGGSAMSDTLVVDLPNLATFTGIRSVVERGANKRFGPTELAQLVWLWEGGLNGPQASEDVFPNLAKRKDGRRGGLSMTVSSSRELDRITGKRVHTWGIGIHLELKQNVQLPALEVVGSSPSSSKQAQEAPSPPSLKRVGMSVLPLWSSKAEDRREQMRRRLGECVIKAHDDFSSGSSTLGSSAPKKRLSGSHDDGIAIPPTPPSSHHKKGTSSATSRGVFTKGFILDALPPIPAATLPPLGPASTSSLSAPALPVSTGIANADVADIAKEENAAILPSTRDTSGRPAKASTEDRRQLLLDGNKAQVQKAPVEQRAMSLLDRIKAKEAAQAAARNAQNGGTTSNGLTGQRKIFTNTKESVARTSLEAASMRAKMKAARNGL